MPLSPVLQGVLFGGLGLVGWGLLDFFLKLKVARVGPVRMLVGMQLAGVPLLAAALWLAGREPSLQDAPLGVLVLLGLLFLLANVSLLRALAVGEVSVVVPITASWSVVAAVLGWAALGDRLSPLQWLAVLGNLAGVMLLSLEGGREEPRGSLAGGVGWAVLALISFSLMNTLLKPVTRQVGALETTLWLKALAGGTGAALFWLAGGRRKKEAPTLARRDLGWFLFLGALDAVGVLGYNLGVTRAPVGVVAAVAAASPVVTLSLAALVLREPLSRRQQVGVALTLLSLVVLAAFAPA